VTSPASGANEPGQPSAFAGAITTNWPVPNVAVAVGAHPDDIEFGCGGTLARWAAAGCVVHLIVLTDGSKGTWDVDADPSALVVTRQDEQRAAARALGATGDVVFIGEVDGELESTRPLREAVALWIRRLRPDVVLGHDPWKRYRLHPDHRVAGQLTCDAVVAAREPHVHLDGVAHHRPQALFLFEADEVNHLEDVTATVEAKLAALEAHASQFESTMRAVDDEGLARFRRRMRDRLAEHGRRVGVPAAEAFALITDL
jgi:LmbE family N-acetylglucosaminyl deacetylase